LKLFVKSLKKEIFRKLMNQAKIGVKAEEEAQKL
jgi:hypothetical protein